MLKLNRERRWLVDDDLCDICMRSGVSVSRTTLAGDTVCGEDACQAEADRRDSEYEQENEDEDA